MGPVEHTITFSSKLRWTVGEIIRSHGTDERHRVIGIAGTTITVEKVFDFREAVRSAIEKR